MSAVSPPSVVKQIRSSTAGTEPQPTLAVGQNLAEQGDNWAVRKNKKTGSKYRLALKKEDGM